MFTPVILVTLVTLVNLFWSYNQFYRAECITVPGFFHFCKATDPDVLKFETATYFQESDYETVTKDRRQHLNSICASHVKGTPDPSRFDAWDQRLSQDLKTNSFLVDHKRRLLYCYNHKVKPAETKMFSRIPLINHLSNVCL